MRANIFVLHQQQNLGQTFGTSEMHLSLPALAKAVVHSKGAVLLLMISTPIVGFVIVLCFCALLYSLICLLTYLRTYLLTYSLTGERWQA